MSQRLTDRVVAAFEEPVLAALLLGKAAQGRERGVEVAVRFEIPPGDAVEIATPAPQRLALYELTRPERIAQLPGRRDF